MTPLRNLLSVAAAFSIAACASGRSGSSSTASTTPKPNMSMTAPTPDPRVGLNAGSTNSDLAFYKDYAIQGNYNGYQVWDLSNPAKPVLKTSFYCPASQSDVSVYRNLLFVSGEGTGGRLDCSDTGVHDSVSTLRLRGIRIFDISDVEHPKYIANVQTCRGSHTNTLMLAPNDTANVYIYVSGSAGVRSPSELPGCSKLAPDQDPNSALFRIEVIKVPLSDPTKAAIV